MARSSMLSKPAGSSPARPKGFSATSELGCSGGSTSCGGGGRDGSGKGFGPGGGGGTGGSGHGSGGGVGRGGGAWRIQHGRRVKYSGISTSISKIVRR